MGTTQLDLNGEWELMERPLESGIDAIDTVRALPADLPVEVPGDVNAALALAAQAGDPLVGLNFHDYAARVPQRSWWYRKRFRVPADAADAAACELTLDGLDVHADIWLNTTYLGHHASAFLPFTHAVRQHLNPGGVNVLIVRLTTGAERVQGRHDDFPLLNAVPTEAGRGYPDRGMRERIFLRKPAYTWGWDWSPHLPTCGITGPCTLCFSGVNAIDKISLRTTLEGGRARVQATVELRRQSLTGTAWGHLTLRLTDAQGRVHSVTAPEVLVHSGLTLVPLDLIISRPRLWWPNGSGGQHRYTVEAWLEVDGTTTASTPFRWGLRTVALEQRPGLFRFRVNGVPIFLQGANWIPCDHLYGRTTPARLTHLVAEAAEANFNCLRIWGGGRFELDAFYDACDEHGILLWHDFMSACAPLPADDPAFADLFCREAEYQVRRLSSRACMLLWCGNNEVGGCYEWFRQQCGETRDPAWALYFERLPRIVHAYAPHLPYWPTSPYGGAESVSDLTVGDDHHWVVMRPDERFWSHPEYWDGADISIFNSEYGYGGPCSRRSTESYMDSPAPDLFNATGREHTNTFYDIPRVNFSIRTHYRDPEGLPLDDYIRFGGLCQGLNLGYSLESMRANRQTWGGLFWTFNDAWGENGWSIVDYHLRRKVSFYNVRRCLAPRRLVLRRGGAGFGGEPGQVVLVAVNATARRMRLRVQLGYQRYDGSEENLNWIDVDVAPRTHSLAATYPEPEPALLRDGTVVAIPARTTTVEPALWRHCTFRDAGVPPAHVRILRTHRRNGRHHVTLRTDHYAHAVALNTGDDARPSDQYFNLLPGQSKTVSVQADMVPTDWIPTASWVNRTDID